MIYFDQAASSFSNLQPLARQWQTNKYVSHETKLVRQLLFGLEKMDEIRIGDLSAEQFRIPVVLFKITGIPSEELAMTVDFDYQIAVRGGLACIAVRLHLNRMKHQSTD